MYISGNQAARQRPAAGLHVPVVVAATGVVPMLLHLRMAGRLVVVRLGVHPLVVPRRIQIVQVVTELAFVQDAADGEANGWVQDTIQAAVQNLGLIVVHAEALAVVAYVVEQEDYSINK